MRGILKGHLAAVLLALSVLALADGEARAMTGTNLNLVDLLRNSTSILKGTVTGVTDGFDAAGLPYTEITVEISRTLRGQEKGTYTFRQFGLLNPRLSADGTRKMLPAPSGFPKYADGDEVFLFLSRPAELTGLRTTMGLGAGKFSFGPGRIENDLANEGLFQNLSIDEELSTSNDVRMLETEIGAVNPDTFQSFVERAITGRWVENCKIWNTSEGRGCTGGGTSAPGVVQKTVK
jgi:hypothetical protein